MQEPGTNHRLGVLLPKRFAFALVLILLVAIVIVLPLAVVSAVGDFVGTQADQRFSLTPPGTPHAADYNRLRLQVTGMDEWTGLAAIQLTGAHICNGTCDHDAKFLFVSVPLQNAQQVDGLPSAVSVTYPPDAVETSQELKLPVSGSSIEYPFDTYRLRLGVVMVRIFDDKSTKVLSTQDATGDLFLSMRSHVARLDLSRHQYVDPASVRPSSSPYQYVYVQDLTFERPLYLKVLTVLLVLLIGAAAAYAVFMRPFDQLVLNCGALVLGVWGIRAILLGPGVPGITAVDLALSAVILFLLVAVTARALRYLGRAGQIELAPEWHNAPPERPLPSAAPHAAEPAGDPPSS